MAAAKALDRVGDNECILKRRCGEWALRAPTASVTFDSYWPPGSPILGIRSLSPVSWGYTSSKHSNSDVGWNCEARHLAAKTEPDKDAGRP